MSYLAHWDKPNEWDMFRKNHLELSELKNMLKKTEVFLSENQLNLQELDENTSKLSICKMM